MKIKIKKHDERSPCCFGAEQECIVKNGNGEPRKMTMKEAYLLPDSLHGFRVYHEGVFREATPVREQVGKRVMYKIKTGQGIVFIATDDHIHPTLDGEKTTEELTKKDFLTINFAVIKDETWEHNINYFVKVNKIKKLKNYEEEYVYSFKMKDEEKPYFTLANGLVTHS